jgi:hypothetical protein
MPATFERAEPRDDLVELAIDTVEAVVEPGEPKPKKSRRRPLHSYVVFDHLGAGRANREIRIIRHDGASS